MSRNSRPTGFAEILDPEAPPWEHDTVTCKHCQRVIFTVPGTVSTQFLVYSRSRQRWLQVPGAFCVKCMAPVCLPCHAQGRCDPWEKQMERMEKAGAVAKG